MTKTEKMRNDLLDYLNREKEIIQQSIEEHKGLSDDEKIEAGFLVRCTDYKEIGENTYECSVSENYTKWRTGDRVTLVERGFPLRVNAIMVDNLQESIVIIAENRLKENLQLDIIYEEAIFTDTIINLLESAKDGDEMTCFIDVLSCETHPLAQGMNPIDFSPEEDLDEEQNNAVKRILQKPYIYCLQGPPGTGKTKVLSSVAKAFSQKGKDVLILALTHQAVNNALNAVATYHVPLTKIGEPLKGMGLHGHIVQKKDFKKFCAGRRKTKYSKGDVVGMTLHSAIINFGLMRRGFSPSVVLIDEASQIPLPTSSVLGVIGSSSYVFFGDERQMPPIFQPELTNLPLSVSIFEYLKNIIHGDFKTTLHTTYRMNSVICDFVSRNFYEPYGIKLHSFSDISNRKVDDENIENSIEHILIESEECTDFNEAEAQEAVQIAKKYQTKGENVAIITPFRKQVNLMRQLWCEIPNSKDILIDTVERLQGQDVDVIILSTSVSDLDYYKKTCVFIENANRLNVIFSRAKKKAIVIINPLIKTIIDHLI